MRPLLQGHHPLVPQSGQGLVLGLWLPFLWACLLGIALFMGAHRPLTHSPLQHISSRRHRDGVAGKPNPLLSRHKKPRGAAELAVRPWALKIRQWGNQYEEEKGTRATQGEVGFAGPKNDFFLSSGLLPDPCRAR